MEEGNSRNDVSNALAGTETKHARVMYIEGRYKDQSLSFDRSNLYHNLYNPPH